MERLKIIPLFLPAFLMTCVLWITFAADIYFNLHLWQWGLYPRTFKGLIGIVTMPFIHGDIFHLINNTIPLIILTTLLYHFYRKFFYRIIALIWFTSGLWTWVIARPSYHIGASAMIYGLAAFIFFAGLILKEKRHAAISFLTVFLYGSIVWGIFPIDIEQSWEGHLTGFLAGTILAYFYKREIRDEYQPPSPPEEDEEEDDNENGEYAYWKNDTSIN